MDWEIRMWKDLGIESSHASYFENSVFRIKDRYHVPMAYLPVLWFFSALTIEKGKEKIRPVWGLYFSPLAVKLRAKGSRLQVSVFRGAGLNPET